MARSSNGSTGGTKTPRRTRRAKAGAVEVLPVLPLRDTVVFPDSMAPLVVQREASARLLDHAGGDADRVVLVAMANPAVDDLDDATSDDLAQVGTEVQVHRRIALPDGTVRALVQGVRRVQLGAMVDDAPDFRYEVSALPDSGDATSDEVRALHGQLLASFADAVEHAPYLPDELAVVAANTEEPGELCHLIASTVRFPVEARQRVLETVDVHERQRLVAELLGRELELLELGARIQGEVVGGISRSQREFYLRKQLEQIREELGEEEGDELRELRDQLDARALPEPVRTQADRELERLARTPVQSSEHGMIRTYLEWIASLPWGVSSHDDVGLEHARAVLDRDHFALDDVKERILDHLAVSRLTGGSIGGSILCFIGPPGVGKTSLGRSIAEALGRSFSRVSVGGVRDESEIRGHRRTYIGSMPGVIIRALRDAGTSNPVFMVDEIDKMGSDWRGDPASAMLEVLDPEQNDSFRDHYLDLPFDLSKALFICTANRLDTIPPALRDRMETVVLEGYTEAEKLEIAKRHLVPRELEQHGLPRSRVMIGAPLLRTVIADYTREAGVRELDRRIATLARKAARRIAAADEAGTPRPKVRFEVEQLPELLGPRRQQPERARVGGRMGVSTGLAVTGIGGEILFVEAAATPGTGRLLVTGQVGKVMEESARAALTWIRAYAAADFDADGTIEPDERGETFFGSHDIHVHVPAGATPKDGPSAGIAIATALASLWHGVLVRPDVAMTGEVTLTGDVLPIGGLKQKVLAAQRAGIRHVILPERNEEDLTELPDGVASRITFHLVDHVTQVLDIALAPPAR